MNAKSCSYHYLIITEVKKLKLHVFICSKICTWIGCNDIAHEGRFVWSHNNQVVTYFKWYSGQPDNYGKNEDCCMLVHDRRWNDYPCNEAIESFICKK